MRAHSETYQCLTHEGYWRAIKDMDFLWCKTIWQFSDKQNTYHTKEIENVTIENVKLNGKNTYIQQEVTFVKRGLKFLLYFCTQIM